MDAIEAHGNHAAIRSARPKDFLAVAALDRLAWPQQPDTFIPDGEHIWRVWLEYATVMVAAPTNDSEVQIAGAAVMFPTTGDELFLHKIMVHPDHRRRGLGSKLMQAMLESATKLVLLTVDPDNQAAVRLYQKMGFQIRETVSGFYRPHEDRHVMAFQPAGDSL